MCSACCFLERRTYVKVRTHVSFGADGVASRAQSMVFKWDETAGFHRRSRWCFRTRRCCSGRCETRSLCSPWASRRTRFGRRKVQPSWRQEPGTCTQTCSYEGEIHTHVHMSGNLCFVPAVQRRQARNISHIILGQESLTRHKKKKIFTPCSFV